MLKSDQVRFQVKTVSGVCTRVRLALSLRSQHTVSAPLELSVGLCSAGPSYSQDQDQDQGQDPGPDFGHHWRRIKMLNVAKNIKISIEYQNWHNIVYIYQFLTRNLYIYYFFWLLEFDYFLALQHDNWAPRTSPGPTQDHGFGPLKHKILTFGLYSIYVMNIEINCDNHAKFQVEIYMLTIF